MEVTLLYRWFLFFAKYNKPSLFTLVNYNKKVWWVSLYKLIILIFKVNRLNIKQ